MRAVQRLGVLAIIASLGLASCDVSGKDKAGGADEGVAGCSKSEGSPVELRYRVESGPTSPGSFSETMSAVCARLARLGLRDVEVGQAGPALVVSATEA